VPLGPGGWLACPAGVLTKGSSLRRFHLPGHARVDHAGRVNFISIFPIDIIGIWLSP
jgi:hypothetical protein